MKCIKMAEANPQSEIHSKANIKEYVKNSKEKLEKDAECAKSEINTKLNNLIETINSEKKENLKIIDRELRKGIDQLRKYENKSLARLSTKERMAKDFKENVELLSKLNHEFDEELNKRPELPSFKMQWNPNLIRVCEDDVKMGNLKIFYQSRFEDSRLLWSKLNKGKEVNEVGEPKAVAIDPETSNIYVGDALAGKIIVLNKFREYLNTLKFKKPSSIGDMTICQNYIYCTSNKFWSNAIYRIDKNTGELLNKFNNIIIVDSFTAVPDKVYFCCYGGLYTTSPDLRGWNRIQLGDDHDFSIINIKCICDELVMLISDPQDYPIQIFSKKGIFQREIALDLSPLNTASKIYMCIDEQWNIILSISGQVNVYSKVGKFITRVGTEGDDNEGMYRPRGIALDKDGNLLVCNNRNRNILQAYL